MVSPNDSKPPPDSGGPGDIPPGTVLGERYRIDRVLGHGAMGKVYAGEHVLLRKRVAVKILRGDRAHVPEVVARFQREAMAAANIEHPNIAGASDFGRLPDGSVYLVLEYVDGMNLRDEIRRGPLALPRSLHIARQMASALRAAEELKIVHRDLKPENIMLVEKRGEADFVKVLDFGIARVPMADSEKQPLTKMGVVFGTPEYMSPEQALGLRVDGRADLFALGVILFEMIAGVRPYPQGARNLGRVATVTPTFADRNPAVTVPRDIEAFIQKLLAPKVAERVQSAADALAELESLTPRFGPGATASLGAAAVAPAQATSNAPPRVTSNAPPRVTSNAPPRVTSNAPPRVTSNAPPRVTSNAPPRVTSNAPPRVTSNAPPAAEAAAPRLETFLPGDPLPAFELPLETIDPAAPQDAPVEPPTLLRAPKVDATSISPAPSDVPAQSAQQLAHPVEQRAPGAEPLRWVTRLGEATLASHARACAFIDSHREHLPNFVRRRVKRLRASQLLALVIAIVFGVMLLLILISTALLSTEEENEVVASDSPPLETAPAPATAASAVPSGAEKLEMLRRSAERTPSDAAVQLELARAEADIENDAAAITALGRALAANPKIAEERRVAEVVADVLRSEAPAGDDEAFALLQGSLGQRGAELVYEAWLEPKNPERVRARAKAWLDTKDFDRASSPGVYSAFKLRTAESCDQKFHLLRLAGNVGERHALVYLRELEKVTRCDAKQEGCYACLDAEGRLKDTIARVEQRLSP